MFGAGVREKIEGVDNGTALAFGDRCPQPLPDVIIQWALGIVTVAQLGGQPAEGAQVFRPDPPARPRKQPNQL